MDKENKRFFNRLSNWVNADEGLPTLEELEKARAHESHEGHEEHGTHHKDTDGAVPVSSFVPPAPSGIVSREPDDGAEDEELQYPDAILVAEDKQEIISALVHEPSPPVQRVKTPPKLSPEQRKRVDRMKKLYIALAGILATLIIAVLLFAVSGSPEFGSPENPSINEVFERYVEKGMEETGATNIVAAMILDYRAFDTLGESVMLFTATMAVVMLLRETKQTSSKKEKGGEA